MSQPGHSLRESYPSVEIQLVYSTAWADWANKTQGAMKYYLYSIIGDACYVLTFWPSQKCHSRWCTGRKWHILVAVMRGNRVGGNWLMKWDKVKKIPLYSHRLTHRKRATSELHDSYFHLMTITQAIPKIAEVTHPGRQISEEVAEACPYHRVGVWR